MAFPIIHTQDCFTITKKFERAAHYCVTDESVFALMTPILNNMRIVSQAFIDQVDKGEAIKTGKFSTRGQALAAEGGEPYDSLGGYPAPEYHYVGDPVADLLAKRMKECFPCEFRFDSAEAYWTKMWDEMREHWERVGKTYESMLNQLLGLQDFFNLDNAVADICKLQQFFTDFFCIPDLQRMIASLMAVLAKLAIELSSSFGMILNLIAPLMTPFLQSVLNTLTQYAMLIVRPMQCAIDAMVAFLDKLDYSDLFQSPPANVSIGPKGGVGNKKSELTIKGVKGRTHMTPDASLYGIPQTKMASHEAGKDITIGEWERPDLSWGGTVDINPFHQVNKMEQEAVDEAKANLASVKADRKNYDLTDEAQKAEYNKRLNTARDGVKEAQKEQSYTEIQKARATIAKFKGYIRSIFTALLGYIKEAIDIIEQLVQDLGGELQKLLKSLTGATDIAMSKMFKKLEIIKLIEMIAAIIELIRGKRSCNEEPLDFAALYPTKQGIAIWTDDQGNVHIEENGDDIQDALDALVRAGGTSPSGAPFDPNSTPNDNQAMQKLNSLIRLTGDDTLDTTIAKTVERITIPSRVVFKCTFETTKVQAAQVNKWLEELNKA